MVFEIQNVNELDTLSNKECYVGWEKYIVQSFLYLDMTIRKILISRIFIRQELFYSILFMERKVQKTCRQKYMNV